jgi:hypothetical protein
MQENVNSRNLATPWRALRKVLREHEELALRYFWEERNEPTGTRIVWEYVKDRLPKGSSVSRATIVNFLKWMAEEGVLGYEDTTGRGGHFNLYYAKLDEWGFEKHVIRVLIESLLRDFPEVTVEVLKSRVQSL